MPATDHTYSHPSSADDDWPSEYFPDQSEHISTIPAIRHSHVVSAPNNHASIRGLPTRDADSPQCLDGGRTEKKENDKSYIRVPRMEPDSHFYGTQSSLAPAQRPCVPIPFAKKLGHFPGLMHRSSLFSVGRADDEPRGGEAKSQGGYDLEVDGPALSMHDKAVWEALVDIAKERDHDLSTPLLTSLSEIARKCGAEFTGSRTTNAVRNGLVRLSRVHLECTLAQLGRVKGRLLANVQIGSHGASVSFDPALTSALLGSDLNFHMNPDRRRLLSGSLAQWMHDFLSTHTESRPLTLKYIRELCGFPGDPKRFPSALSVAMEELKAKAPELVPMFVIDRKTRSGDYWTILVTRGSESPKFVGFKPDAARQEPRRGSHRGGVAL